MNNQSNQFAAPPQQQFVGHGNRIMMNQIENKIQQPPAQDEKPCSICTLKYGSSARNNIPGVT